MAEVGNFPPACRISQQLPSAPSRKGKIVERLVLEHVLGITLSSSSGLSSDVHSGLLAYPAGCVVVLLDPQSGEQTHIINSCRKPISALTFSADDKLLATGESGHQPAVRVWSLCGFEELAVLQGHSFGISAVAFSPLGRLLVSVGFQHDMLVNVWDWKKNLLVASNKASSCIRDVSFAPDGSFFVTSGIRHIRFWHLDALTSSKTDWPVPLRGRSCLLGEQQNNQFCAVVFMDDQIFAVTRSGLLCVIEQRVLQRYIELKASSALSLAAGDGMIFCGCTNGVVRVFASDLHILFNLPRPHCLGDYMTPGTELPKPQKDQNFARFPDVVALSYNGARHWLACAYSDHSLYVWHVGESPNGKDITCEFSALYHSACVWGVEMYPELPDRLLPSLPIGSFITASDDNTLRMWHARACVSPSKASLLHQNDDSLKVIHIEAASGRDSGSCEAVGGLRALCINPDGQELASGDKMGNVRIHDLHGQQETRLLAAHNSEVLCLNYLPTKSSNLCLLASASRDRLIHIFDAANNYTLLQTLDEHSSSITAVKLVENGQQVHMISCGGDKSIYFHTALMMADGPQFNMTHHVVEKCTLYDMTVDIDGKYAAVGCQDRMIRMFSVESGKQKKAYKGAQGDDGSLIKVQLDPSGTFVVSSCTDKFLSIFDFNSGECVASACGHSDIVTSMKFSDDGRHLISASGDSCVFVWRLPAHMTNSIARQRSPVLSLERSFAKPTQNCTPASSTTVRRETFVSIPRLDPWLDPCRDLENSSSMVTNDEVEQPSPLTMLNRNEREVLVHAFLRSTGRTPDWAKSQNGVICVTQSPFAQVKPKPQLPAQRGQAVPPGPRRCWGIDLDLSDIKCRLDKLSRLASTLSPVTQSPKPSLTTLTCKGLSNTNTPMPGTMEVMLEKEEDSFSQPKYTGDIPSSAVDLPKSNDPPLHFQGIPEAVTESGLYKVQEVVRKNTRNENRDSTYSSCSSLHVCETEHLRRSVSNCSDSTWSADINNEVENIPPQTDDIPETLCDAFLMRNFDTLTDAVSGENFNQSLQELQPNANVLLNPRLSISARFLGKARAARRLPSLMVNQQILPNSCGPAIRKTKVLQDRSCSRKSLILTNNLVQAKQRKTEPNTFLPFGQHNGFEGQTETSKLKSRSLILRKSSSVGDIPSKGTSTSGVQLAKCFSLSPPLYQPTIKPSQHSFPAWGSSSVTGAGKTLEVRSEKGLDSSTHCLSQADLIPSSTTDITTTVLLPEKHFIVSPSPRATVLKFSRRRHSSPMPCWIASSEFSVEEGNSKDLDSWLIPNCSPQDGHLEKECTAELSVETDTTESEFGRSSVGSEVMEPCHNGSNELVVQMVGPQVEREGETFSSNPVSNSSIQWVSAVEDLEVGNSHVGAQARPTCEEAKEQSTEVRRSPVEVVEVHIHAVPKNVDKSKCQEVAADLQRAFEQAISTYLQVVMVQGESCTALQEVFSTIEEKLRGLSHVSSKQQCHDSLPDGLLQGLLEQYSDKLLLLVSTKLKASAPN
uniref:mitogen-activated protein kinase-binding protein 1-like isoform X2 n=1 Tax=Myxine glutinosa TaxID=7769 RepID=UPI00358F0D66